MSSSVSKATLTVFIALAAAGCDSREPPPHLRIEGGDSAAGRRLVHAYGCGTCHMIEGVPGARGAVGPSLDDFAQRIVIAGAYPNTPRMLVRWLINPPAMRPGTAMPRLGLSEAEAIHIATYLYTRGAAGAVVYQSRPTEAQYPWLADAEASRATDRARLTEARRMSPERARIPIERAMDIMANRPDGSR